MFVQIVNEYDELLATQLDNQKLVSVFLYISYYMSSHLNFLELEIHFNIIAILPRLLCLIHK
jgi:hypothetical protein